MKNIIGKMKLRICIILVVAFTIPTIVFAQTIGVFYDSNVAQIKFAVGDIKAELESRKFTVEMLPLSALSTSYAKMKIVILLESNSKAIAIFKKQGGTMPKGLGEQAYGLRTISSPKKSYWVIGGDINGAMYRALQLAEDTSAEELTDTYTKQTSPMT